MKIRTVIAALGLSPLLFACDSDTTEPGYEQPDAFGGGGASAPDGGAGGSTSGDAAVGGSSSPGALRLSFTREVRPRDGSAAEVDLIVYDFANDIEKNLTTGLNGALDCATRLCKLNPEMTWVGWLGASDVRSISLFVAPVEPSDDPEGLRIDMDHKRLVADQVLSFDFAGERLVYSQGGGSGEDLSVFAEPIAPCGESDPTACRLLVGQINPNGAFRTTHASSVVILVRTDLSSMTINLHNIDSGAEQTLYTFGDPGGTGSEFSGHLPLALAPDSTYLAVITRNDFLWRIWSLEAVPNPPEPSVHELYESQTSPAGDCTRPMPYGFNLVRFDPRFSPDSARIYLLAAGNCARQRPEAPTNRDDSDILRIGKTFEGGVVNITNNPRINHWSNHDIGDFALTPDGERIAFVASRPLDTQSRSIWLIDTDNSLYDCTRQPVLDKYEPTDVNEPDRCEFILGDHASAAITHRGLTFHNQGD